MLIKEITNKNFNKEVLEVQGPILIEFWAPWCGYCKRLSPVMDQVAGEYE